MQGVYRRRLKYNLVYAKAVDRLNVSLKQGIPAKLLAINVALNTAHQIGGAYEDVGLRKADLDRWSRMGVQPKATAKRYLESSVSDTIDLILEGGSPLALAGGLV